MKHKILSLIVLISLNACVKLKKKGGDEAPPANTVAEQSQEINKTLKYSYDFSESKTQVVFHFPDDWQDSVWVEKSIAGEKIFQGEVLQRDFKWVDSIDREEKVNYKFFQNKLKNPELLAEVEVLPVLDLFVDQDLNLAEIYKLNSKTQIIYFRRLEIKNSAHLFIEDYSGAITVENLNSEQGVLQTFKSDQRAQLETSGRSAGKFDLNILSGSGLLQLNVLAEAGGDGKPGLEPDENLTGLKGNDGDYAKFSVVSTNQCGMARDLCFTSYVYDCTTPPTSGSEGGQGKRGYGGSNAGNGGSVFKPKVSNQSSEIKIVTSLLPGRKGLGGMGASGGRGGEGGLGGDGGDRDFLLFFKLDPNDPRSKLQLFSKVLSKKCASAANGERGLKGETGAHGHDGQDGIVIE